MPNINKENIDLYLAELGKAFRKFNGKKMPAEIIIVGGASVLINYGFRDATMDIDAIIYASSAMRDAISYVANKYNLTLGWLNSDFQHTSSYSDKLIEHSKYYRTFSNILQIRTISAEYLVAMKMKSLRDYKNDYSDIIGIIASEGNELTYQKVLDAIKELYGSTDAISRESLDLLKTWFSSANLNETYEKTIVTEKNNLAILKDFDKKYPNTLKRENIKDILNSLKQKETK